jgi:propionate CoA-transferase
VCAHGAMKARDVVVPGVMVDCSVVAQAHNHHQTYGTVYSPAFAGEYRVALDSLAPMPLDERKIIARRAAFELPMGGVVNLGIGMPEGVAAVANEEGILGHVTLTAEPGVIGGVPQSGLDFGAAVNTEALIHQNQQFDFYDGGGLDMACLGMAEIDADGNVNVSRFGPKLAGAGGFINISQNARKLVFAGTFTAGGLRVQVDGTELVIVREGRSRKFVKAVEQITFSGAYAAEKEQPVLYVTERCVFRRTHDGMELVEVAPGIDIERDILALMHFKPMIRRDPMLMDARIFREGMMDLRGHLLSIPLDQRFTVDEQQNLFFVNLERFALRSHADIDAIAGAVEAKLGGLGRRVYAIVNYDNFSIVPELLDDYSAMVRSLTDRFYSGVSRYTTSGFLRIKLGEALRKRGVAPHIFERAEKAQSDWRNVDGAGL